MKKGIWIFLGCLIVVLLFFFISTTRNNTLTGHLTLPKEDKPTQENLQVEAYQETENIEEIKEPIILGVHISGSHEGINSADSLYYRSR